MIYCNQCQTIKAEGGFYKSSIRKDGVSGSCKECIRSNVKANRAKNAEYYREFDRKRANNPDRVQARRDYKATEVGQKAALRCNKAWRKRNPASYQAQNAVNNAIRDSKLLKPSECQECRKVTALHGHHCDYNKPLEVMWLCEVCHKQWHRDNTPIYCDEKIAS